MKDDPTITRIREVRHSISEKCGHDPKKLVEYYIQRTYPPPRLKNLQSS